MDRITVKDLKNYLNKEIISSYVVTMKEVRMSGNNNHFIRLKLADKTGKIVANVWNNAVEIGKMFEEGDLIKIKANVIKYKGQFQLSVTKVRAIPEDEYDLTQYVETTKKNLDKLADDFFDFIDSIKNEFLKKLLDKIFDPMFFSKFCKAPAAKTWHHNYIGGLLEHSVGVAKVCELSAKNYDLDRDLIIAGALLHDVGKVFEYNSKLAIDFTYLGRLIGHIPLGDQIITENAAQINDFPKNLLMKLRHLILSHHGEYEKASCRLPQTIEAVALHFADNLDAQTIGVKQVLQASNTEKNSKWSDFDRINNKFYYTD